MNNQKILGVIVMALAILTSCTDIVTYNDGYDDGLSSDGPPSVQAVFYPRNLEQEITSASLSEVVSITGSNLSGVVAVLVNDVEVDLKEVYATRDRLSFKIPRAIPNEVTNMVYIETLLGEAEIALEVQIPELIMSGLYNEFASPGDTVSISGDYFDLYLLDSLNMSLTYNGEAVDAFNFTSTSFNVRIPNNAVENSEFALSTPSVELIIPFKEEGHQILDVNTIDVGGFVENGEGEGAPEPLIGNYIRIVGTYGAWAWEDIQSVSFNLDDQDVVDNVGEYWVEFEMYTNPSYPLNTEDQVLFNYVTFTPQINGGMAINTYGDWKTIKLEASAVFPSIALGDVSFAISFMAAAERTFDFAMCNFRLVKKR